MYYLSWRLHPCEHSTFMEITSLWALPFMEITPLWALLFMEIIPVSTNFYGDYPSEHYLLWWLSLWARFMVIIPVSTFLWWLSLWALLFRWLSMWALFMVIIRVSTTFYGDYPCEHYFLWWLSLWALLFMFHDLLWHHNG